MLTLIPTMLKMLLRSLAPIALAIQCPATTITLGCEADKAIFHAVLDSAAPASLTENVYEN